MQHFVHGGKVANISCFRDTADVAKSERLCKNRAAEKSESVSKHLHAAAMQLHSATSGLNRRQRVLASGLWRRAFGSARPADFRSSKSNSR